MSVSQQLTEASFKQGFVYHFPQGPAADSFKRNSHRIFSLNDVTDSSTVCAKYRQYRVPGTIPLPKVSVKKQMSKDWVPSGQNGQKFLTVSRERVLMWTKILSISLVIQ